MGDLENLRHCLRQVSEIRSASNKLWTCVSDGVGIKHANNGEDKNEDKEKHFFAEIKSLLATVASRIG